MISEFRHNWLHGLSKRLHSTELSEQKVDVIITASSWDSRCLTICSEAALQADASIMLKFSARDNSGLRDKHDPALETYLRRQSKHFYQINGSSSDVSDLWNQLREKLLDIAIKLQRPISIFIDISTMPRFLTGAVIALALSKGIATRLVAFYAEGLYEGSSSDQQIVFTGERWRFVPIAGIEGNYDSTKSRFFLVSSGFEGSKTLRYLATQEPDRVSLLLAEPGFDSSYTAKAWKHNAALIEHFHIPAEQIAKVHAGDAIAAWSELTTREFERFDSENVSYLCCGTKAHSMALMLRAISVGSASVLYNIPDSHKVVDTKPTGFVWTYELRDVSRLANYDSKRR